MNQIVYQILEEKYLEQTIACITEAFVNSEPMTQSLKITAKEFDKYAEIFCQEAVRDRMSHIAIDSDLDRVVGFAISRDYLADIPPRITSISEKFIPIIALTENLKWQYATLRNVRHQRKWFYIIMAGVASGYRRQGIAKKLVNENITNAGKKGFTYAVCDATSWCSQRTFFGLGFQEICSIEYKNNYYPLFQVFRNIRKHEKCMFMEKMISPQAT